MMQALSNLLSIEELKQMVDSERTDGEFLVRLLYMYLCISFFAINLETST